MGKFFNPENPVWRFMGKVFDMMVLTVLWIVCSLPIVTIGASTTALYYVTLKMAKDQEGYLFVDFFRSFKQNLKQSTLIWMGVLLLGILFGGELVWYYHFRGGVGVMIFFMILLLTVLYLMVVCYVFPLLARCQTSCKQILIMAFVMAIKNFGWTVLLMTITGCVLAIGIFVCAPVLIFAVGAIAYAQSKIFVMIFEYYKLGIV